MRMETQMMWGQSRLTTPSAAIVALLLALSSVAVAQYDAVTKSPPKSGSRTNRLAAADDFPADLVRWKACPGNPIFTAEGPGHWDVKIRERGWILRDGHAWQLWYTGYDGKREGLKMLGYATSHDGVHWTRSPKNPIYRDHWVEDMSVVHQGDTYYMFAESENDNHAEMLTSKNGVDWKWIGKLDVRQTDETKIARRPCGTPTVWVEGSTWYLMYEWMDKGIWLATTKDPMSLVWRDVKEEPVLSPGPGPYDKELMAVNQVIKLKGTYYAIYHGSGSGAAVPRTWTTDIARSTDRVHWQKYSGNPIVAGNKSSGMVVPMAKGFRLYTMHDQVDLYESK
jgi:beta-1,2-mannobiose phosphorylase / 1,2-beta-oligomannan phosphorylase